MLPYRSPGFTPGNLVEPLIDGKAYLDHLATSFAGMTAGDYYHFSAWRATPTHPVQPDVPGSPTYMNQLLSLIGAGVAVRGLLWYVPGSFWDVLGVAPTQAAENITVVDGLITGGGHAVLDHRVVSYIVSHHQKKAVLTTGGGSTAWAYVGGIDVAFDRWDTPAHSDPTIRPKEKFAGWHDVHTAIRGAAVAQVWENFKQRWNDPTRPHAVPGIPGGAVPTPITGSAPAPATFGSHNVQLLRTLACKNTYSFLPGGEQTVRLAYEQAIDLAEHYIYIEDQYAWPCTLASRLNAAARRGVKVIFVLAHEYDMAALRYNHNYLRHDEFLDVVRAGTAAPNVSVYHLQRPSGGDDIYVHSKLMIIDDCYAAIGSANIGHRSHTSDSELHIAVVDDDIVGSQMNGAPVTVCRFARQLRMNLWDEHIGPGLYTDPIASLSSWPSPSGPTQVHHAVVHPKSPWYKRWSGLIRYSMNKRTRCPEPLIA